MKTLFSNYKYLLLRRITQVSIMLLYVIANTYGINILMGNLSSSLILKTIPLSDPYAVLQMFFAGAVISFDVLLGAFIILIFYGVVGGRAFCSWVCPVNIITDAANYLRRKLKLNQIEKKQPASRNLRYYIIVISFFLSFFLGVAAFEFISPISMVHRGIIFGLGFGWAAMMAIFLFDLFVLKNGWCGHLCPLGGFYSIVGKFSLIRVHHNHKNCTACMKCKTVCPESQVLKMVTKESKPVISGECTNCGRCVDVCDDDALIFSIRNKKHGEKNESN